MRRFGILITVLLVTFVNLHAQIVATKEGENGLEGFIDAKGKWIVPPKYEYANWHNDQKIGTFQKKIEVDGSRGMIDENGKVIFPIGKFKFYFRDDTNGQLTDYVKLTDMNGNEGLGNMKGKVIIPCQYKDLFINQESPKQTFIIIHDKNENIGIATENGRIIIPCKYKHEFIKVVSDAQDPYIIMTDFTGKKAVFTCQGNQITPMEYDDVSIYKGYIITKSNGFEGLYYLNGKELIPCVYKSVVPFFKEGVIIVTDEYKKKGAYDTSGNLLIGIGTYDDLASAGENLICIKKDKKWGLWGNGSELITCQYDRSFSFINDAARVHKDGEVKLIKNPLKDGSQIQIAENKPAMKKKAKGAVVSRYPAPDSDVDKNIPMAKQKNNNTFAFIIANENYADAPVPYSLNDGRMFKEYCQKTLGLPEKNINLYEDATFGSIITAVEKIKSVAEAYDGDASIIFYYAGHGYPDDKQATAYLLPIDGDASSITTTGYSLSKLYNELSQLKLKSAMVFLDACFSGTKREDQMLSSARGVAIKVREEAPQGNMVVFSAAQGDETAHQLEEKHHGLFTYYLLKELQATSGNVDMGTLTDYVTKQVKRQSVVINNKKQTPTVIPSRQLLDKWKTMRLR